MGKKLAVFCDGTWNEASIVERTNVARLFEATLLVDNQNPPHPQLACYVKGVGTRKDESVTGGIFGYGISDNIKTAYTFIVANFDSGDDIFLFGFSRGAYTARSLAGLIRNIGILKRENLHRIDEGFDKYRNTNDPDWHPDGDKAVKFRKDYSHPDESIKFIGVWDTVGALGAPYGIILGWIVDKCFHTSFHDTKLSSWVKSAYHALAVDERRWPFRPSRWEKDPRHDASNEAAQALGGIPNFEEKWFPGAHSNVGGGYEDARLSDCALKWMADRASRQGLNVDQKLLACNPGLDAPIVNSQTRYYQFLTRLYVLYPSRLWLFREWLFPKEIRQLYRNIDANGDYVRPIDDPPDDVSVAKEKKAMDPSYHPKNIPR